LLGSYQDRLLGYVDYLQFSKDGRTLFGVGGDAFHVWNVSDDGLTRRHRLTHNAGAATAALAQSPQGDVFAVGDVSGRIGLWNVGERAPTVKVIEAGSERIQDLAYSPDGASLAIAGERYVEVRDIDCNKAVHRWQFPGGYMRIAFHPAGKHLFLGTPSGAIYVLEIQANRHGADPNNIIE
jgi:WD40 repeat protein